MKTNKELRQIACEDLKGKWKNAVIAVLVYYVIVVLLSQITLRIGENTAAFFAIIISLLMIPLSWNLNIMFLLNHRKDDEAFNIRNYEKGFNSKIFGTIFLQYVYVFLWSLLLYIPGIIKSISYAMTPYILIDHPELSNNKAIEYSMEMMKGHKMRLFLLILSFIGWIILGALTLGIGYLWIIPYVNSAIANFYEDRKADFENSSL